LEKQKKLADEEKQREMYDRPSEDEIAR